MTPGGHAPGRRTRQNCGHRPPLRHAPGAGPGQPGGHRPPRRHAPAAGPDNMAATTTPAASTRPPDPDNMAATDHPWRPRTRPPDPTTWRPPTTPGGHAPGRWTRQQGATDHPWRPRTRPPDPDNMAATDHPWRPRTPAPDRNMAATDHPWRPRTRPRDRTTCRPGTAPWRLPGDCRESSVPLLALGHHAVAVRSLSIHPRARSLVGQFGCGDLAVALSTGRISDPSRWGLCGRVERRGVLAATGISWSAAGGCVLLRCGGVLAGWTGSVLLVGLTDRAVCGERSSTISGCGPRPAVGRVVDPEAESWCPGSSRREGAVAERRRRGRGECAVADRTVAWSR
jgi:hypothetical protein